MKTISRLAVKSFKQIDDKQYEFSPFDLLVGRNNSGKSTILQALAIWQFCVDEFHRSSRKGIRGIQVVLPNFAALPLPEFNLLWRNRTERKYPIKNGEKKQEYILIEISVTWRDEDLTEETFGVKLRYNSPQVVYAIPDEGWTKFVELDSGAGLPKIAYVPPFSGLEPEEEWRDDGPIRRQIGKAQPGSVLRNLLLRVCPETAERSAEHTANWKELAAQVKRWFSVDLQEPKYKKGVDTRITCEYREGKEKLDIIAGGSGFHQALTLLAFFFGYRPDVILLDEPDAHLHVNLQREILDYFKRVCKNEGVQFLIATHAEEFARGVDAGQLLWLPNASRVETTPPIIAALAEVSNEEITRLLASPYILYVEGESDERILRAWAPACGADDALAKVCFRCMGGGSKADMKDEADRHFSGVRALIPEAQRVMLFDYDEDETAYRPDGANPALFEWKRKNIENYLLVPGAWIRAAVSELGIEEGSVFGEPVRQVVNSFFADENLTLPAGQTWRQVRANIFEVVNGKRVLFEKDDSLFQRLRGLEPPINLPRESVAAAMAADEIHEDVHVFFEKLRAVTMLPS